MDPYKGNKGEAEPNMGIMSKKTAAYLAGLIDGEGSLEIQKRKKTGCKRGHNYVARLRVCMTDKEIIEWLKDSFGGYIYERQGKGNCKDSWSWTIHYSNVKPILMKIRPYLKIKRKRAEILRKFLNTFDSKHYEIKKNKNHGGKHKELKDNIWDYRKELYQQMRQLNKKGSCTLND